MNRFVYIVSILGLFAMSGCAERISFTVDLDEPYAGSPDIAKVLASRPPNSELERTATQCLSCADVLDDVRLKAGGTGLRTYDVVSVSFSGWSDSDQPRVEIMFDRTDLADLKPIVNWFATKPGAIVRSDARGVSNPCDQDCWKYVTWAHECSSSPFDVCGWTIAVDGLTDSTGTYTAILSAFGPQRTAATLTLTYQAPADG